VLVGKVKNDSGGTLTIRVPEVTVLDRGGRRIKASATFSSAYVRSNYPHNAGARSEPSHYPLAEQKRVGYLVQLGSGKTVPLTVSWREARAGSAAGRVAIRKWSLAIPAPQ
jgi:hypothetical protein